MKAGALIVGLIGGLVTLLYGLLGGALLAGGGGNALSKAIVLIVPIAALVGAGMVMAKPLVGSMLMAGAAVVVLLLLGLNFGSLIPVSLLAVAALLGFFAHQEDIRVASAKPSS